MSDPVRFAQAAGRLAGVAGWLLGWSPDAFWAATPAELGAVLRVARGEDAAVDGLDSENLARLRAMFPD